MGSMSSLYIAMSGLHASQNGLHVSANNITNAGTKGYVRQQIVMSPSQYITLRNMANQTQQIGLGVDVETVRQVRDRFLDKSYRQEIGRAAYYSSQYEAISEIEDTFGELESEQYQKALDDFWGAMQELQKDPPTLEARGLFVQSAQTIIERSQVIYQYIKDCQSKMNTYINTTVNRMNELGETIQELNLKILKIEGPNVERANDLRDQRNKALDELAGLASITYNEDKNGVIVVNLESIPFVTEGYVNRIETKALTQGSDLITPVWGFLGDRPVCDLSIAPSTEAGNDLGKLKGLLVARGDTVADYRDMPVAPKPEDYEDGKASDEYKQALSEYNDKVYQYNQKVDPSVIKTAQAGLDQLLHGIMTAINDVFCPNKVIEIDGVQYTVLDEEKAPFGLDGTQGNELFVRVSTPRYTEMDINGVKYKVYNEEDPDDYATLYSINNVHINQELLNTPGKICLTTKPEDQDSKIAAELLKKWNESFSPLNCNELTPKNFSEYYEALTIHLANRGSVLNTVTTSQESLVRSLDNQREETLGVSTDEELTLMMKFQHSYNASSKVINVMSEMMADIIAMMRS